MKTTLKIAVITVLFLLFNFKLKAQNYNPLSYHFPGTPTHGIKIKTNIPFQNGIGMPTVMLEGFEYGGGNVIDIKLNWYVYHGKFVRFNASSSGSYTPDIKLANDNGKVSIYINDKKYYTRFNVRVFSYGKSENTAMFDNWVALDEPISGDNIKDVIYKDNDIKSVSSVYNPMSYHYAGTPNHGIKIKTNIPFQNGIGMPTVMLEGFEYGGGNVIDIKLNWYVYHGKFVRFNASSSGSYTPDIKLANDNGKVSIYINDKKYYTRFNVRVFSYGKSENTAMFDNWVALDEPISGDNIKDVMYKNTFSGNVGIGTITTGNHRLAVEGSIGAREIKVEASGWSDFVFENDYNLPTLIEVENHIKENGHLKDIPSAKEVEENGIYLGEMDSKLLQKIEELILYTIAQEKEIKELKKAKSEIAKQQKEINTQKKEIEELKKQNSEIKELKALVQKLLKDKN